MFNELPHTNSQCLQVQKISGKKQTTYTVYKHLTSVFLAPSCLIF